MFGVYFLLVLFIGGAVTGAVSGFAATFVAAGKRQPYWADALVGGVAFDGTLLFLALASSYYRLIDIGVPSVYRSAWAASIVIPFAYRVTRRRADYPDNA